jgi:hypothetical protein
MSAKSTAPVITTGRAPNRSERAPQIIEVTAMAKNPTVMAMEMPVRDQPVASAIGVSSTGREKSDPMAMHPMKPPAATTTQRYDESAILSSLRPPVAGRPAAWPLCCSGCIDINAI